MVTLDEIRSLPFEILQDQNTQVIADTLSIGRQKVTGWYNGIN